MIPKKGNALLLFSLHPDSTTDPSSLHMSCPVTEGEKWSATKWIYVGDFNMEEKSIVPTGGCRLDKNRNCAVWASMVIIKGLHFIWWALRRLLDIV